MKHPILPSTVALIGLLAACGGSDNPPAPPPTGDAFTNSVATVAATTAEDSDPADITSIVVTTPDDTDPDPVS